MKVSVVLVISVVVVAFCTSCATTTTPNEELDVLVRDVYGNTVTSDARYYILPATRGTGGGGVTRGPELIYGANNDLECPNEVVQSRGVSGAGFPVYFKPKSVENSNITVSTDVNIKFYDEFLPLVCPMDVWVVEGFPGNKTTIPMLLSTKGEVGNPKNVTSWFQIRKANSYAYKFVFCPYGELFCGDIGIQLVDEQMRLAVTTQNPFTVLFVKDPRRGIKSII